MRTSAEERFDALYRAHATSILRFFLRRLSRAPDAADALAEVFVVAWRRIDEVPEGQASRLWLYGVARLTLQNERRRQRRHGALADRLRAEIAARPPVADAPTSSAAEILGALDRLGDDDRELLMLTGWDGLTPTEAAAVLGVQASAARVRLHRARGRLRAQLEDMPSTQERIEISGQVPRRNAPVHSRTTSRSDDDE